MEQYVLKLYNVYINDDPEFTLTHFKTISNLAKLVFILKVGSRPRYHVSIYRTIGPLVLISDQDLDFGYSLELPPHTYNDQTKEKLLGH